MNYIKGIVLIVTIALLSSCDKRERTNADCEKINESAVEAVFVKQKSNCFIQAKKE